jgi:hypothetical protein
VYPASYGSGESGVKPIIGVDFSGGNATVTPGSQIGRSYAHSERNSAGYGKSVGSAMGGGDAACSTGGG